MINDISRLYRQLNSNGLKKEAESVLRIYKRASTEGEDFQSELEKAMAKGSNSDNDEIVYDHEEDLGESKESAASELKKRFSLSNNADMNSAEVDAEKYVKYLEEKSSYGFKASSLNIRGTVILNINEMAEAIANPGGSMDWMYDNQYPTYSDIVGETPIDDLD
jgi:hypothetical protein